MESKLALLRNSRLVKLSVLLYVLLSAWWVFIYLGGTKQAQVNNDFGFVYGGFSLWGGFIGLFTSRLWGGLKSLVGRAIICLAIGLLCQGFGQYSFWAYNVFFHVEVPYPGIPDIGFFTTILFYTYAAILLARTAGAKLSLRLWSSKLQAVGIPALLLLVGYWLFLRNYEFDFSNPLKIFLDFGYPLGQAIYISMGILTYSLSIKYLGGLMKWPILVLIFAFFMQFLSDYLFVYFQDQFYPASFIDYLYLTSYFLMTLGLLFVRNVALKMRTKRK
jgi:hypothetical protein